MCLSIGSNGQLKCPMDICMSNGSNGPLDILPLPSHWPATCMGSMPAYYIIRDNLLNTQPNVQWTYASIGSNGQIKCPLDISICPLDILQRYWTLIKKCEFLQNFHRAPLCCASLYERQQNPLKGMRNHSNSGIIVILLLSTINPCNHPCNLFIDDLQILNAL
jgi:hypothetical protein